METSLITWQEMAHHEEFQLFKMGHRTAEANHPVQPA